MRESILVRKKPATVRAIRWTGENRKAVIDFMGQPVTFMRDAEGDAVVVPTSNGSTLARIGDWVLKQQVDGKMDMWPVHEATFAATYEVAE